MIQIAHTNMKSPYARQNNLDNEKKIEKSTYTIVEIDRSK